jgi:hypothetical protein
LLCFVRNDEWTCVAAWESRSAPIAAAARIGYNRAMTQASRPVGPGDHVFLIDGSSFVFRAYFQSIRQDQKYNYRSDRLPVGAVRLFATKVLQFLRDGASGDHLRQVGAFVPARNLSPLQGPSPRSA